MMTSMTHGNDNDGNYQGMNYKGLHLFNDGNDGDDAEDDDDDG